MNFNLMDLFSQFMQNGALNSESTNQQNSIPNNSVYLNTDYPEPIFTNNKNINIQSHTSFQNNQISQNNNGLFSSLLNPELIKTILPLFSGKNDSKNMGNIFQNFNPQMSNILSMFSKKNKKEKQENSNIEEKIIDLDEYIEVD